ncbi:MAG: protein kinase family protein, partial [Oligoflexia bacterium]|nr:protein kinase family protein [Oligoflexia bacterium]
MSFIIKSIFSLFVTIIGIGLIYNNICLAADENANANKVIEILDLVQNKIFESSAWPKKSVSIDNEFGNFCSDKRYEFLRKFAIENYPEELEGLRKAYKNDDSTFCNHDKTKEPTIKTLENFLETETLSESSNTFWTEIQKVRPKYDNEKKPPYIKEKSFELNSCPSLIKLAGNIKDSLIRSKLTNFIPFKSSETFGATVIDYEIMNFPLELIPKEKNNKCYLKCTLKEIKFLKILQEIFKNKKVGETDQIITILNADNKNDTIAKLAKITKTECEKNFHDLCDSGSREGLVLPSQVIALEKTLNQAAETLLPAKKIGKTLTAIYSKDNQEGKKLVRTLEQNSALSNLKDKFANINDLSEFLHKIKKFQSTLEYPDLNIKSKKLNQMKGFETLLNTLSADPKTNSIKNIDDLIDYILENKKVNLPASTSRVRSLPVQQPSLASKEKDVARAHSLPTLSSSQTHEAPKTPKAPAFTRDATPELTDATSTSTFTSPPDSESPLDLAASDTLTRTKTPTASKNKTKSKSKSSDIDRLCQANTQEDFNTIKDNSTIFKNPDRLELTKKMMGLCKGKIAKTNVKKIRELYDIICALHEMDKPSTTDKTTNEYLIWKRTHPNLLMRENPEPTDADHCSGGKGKSYLEAYTSMQKAYTDAQSKDPSKRAPTADQIKNIFYTIGKVISGIKTPPPSGIVNETLNSSFSANVLVSNESPPSFAIDYGIGIEKSTFKEVNRGYDFGDQEGECVIAKPTSSKKKILDSFEREAVVMSELNFDGNQRGIARPIKKFNLPGHQIIYTQKFYSRGDLLNKTISDNTIRDNVYRDLITGMSFMHKKGILHLDVKPENFFFDGTHAYIADFGKAIKENNSAFDSSSGEGGIDPGDNYSVHSYDPTLIRDCNIKPTTKKIKDHQRLAHFTNAEQVKAADVYALGLTLLRINHVDSEQADKTQRLIACLASICAPYVTP